MKIYDLLEDVQRRLDDIGLHEISCALDLPMWVVNEKQKLVGQKLTGPRYRDAS